MGLTVARCVPPRTSLADLTNLIRIIIRHRIYELEYLARQAPAQNLVKFSAHPERLIH